MPGLRVSRRELLTALPAVLLSGGSDVTAAQLTRDWRRRDFSAAGFTRLVVAKGSGTPVVLMHELPGPTAEHFSLAEKFVSRGFAVHVPILFGQAGQKSRKFDTGRYFLSKCGPRSEFSCGSTEPSRIHSWIVALCDAVGTDTGLPVVAIGMCMTGIMPLAALRSRRVVVPVLCQPALPMGNEHAAALGLPPSDVELARTRMERESIKTLLVRFEHDRLCPDARVDSLRRAFGSNLELCELDGDEHSTLVHDHSTAAMSRVLEFIERTLATRRKAP